MAPALRPVRWVRLPLAPATDGMRCVAFQSLGIEANPVARKMPLCDPCLIRRRNVPVTGRLVPESAPYILHVNAFCEPTVSHISGRFHLYRTPCNALIIG